VCFSFQAIPTCLGSSGSCWTLLKAYDPERAGCLVLDVRAPGAENPQPEQAVPYATQIEIPVVLLSSPLGQLVAATADRSNLLPFPPGRGAPNPILEVIEAAIEGDSRKRETRLHGAEISRRLRGLTRREREVMAMVVHGMSNRSIGDRFGISSRTVEVHRARVMEKMAAGSLSELVRMACLIGAVPAPGPETGHRGVDA
jgi:two-component system response regulator FixJ